MAVASATARHLPHVTVSRGSMPVDVISALVLIRVTVADGILPTTSVVVLLNLKLAPTFLIEQLARPEHAPVPTSVVLGLQIPTIKPLASATVLLHPLSTATTSVTALTASSMPAPPILTASDASGHLSLIPRPALTTASANARQSNPLTAVPTAPVTLVSIASAQPALPVTVACGWLWTLWVTESVLARLPRTALAM